MLHHATLWVFLLIAATAVGASEWRRRVVLAAAGGQTPSTERYLARPIAIVLTLAVAAVPLHRPSGPRYAPDSDAGHTAGELLGYVGTWQLAGMRCSSPAT